MRDAFSGLLSQSEQISSPLEVSQSSLVKTVEPALTVRYVSTPRTSPEVNTR